MRGLAAALSAVLAAAYLAPASAAAAWEARSEHFHVVSTLGPEIVERAAASLEQTRRIYLERGLSLRRPGPVTVVVTPTLLELAPYVGPRLGATRGLSLAAPDHNYILVAWTAPGDPLVALAHEYGHLVDPYPDAPLWFREGLADYLSFLRRDDAGRLRPLSSTQRLSRLREAVWLPYQSVLQATRRSGEAGHPAFQAQAWLAVRWLAAREPDVRRLRPADLEELDPGAVEQTLRAFLAELKGEPETPPPPPAVEVTVNEVPGAEVGYWLADFDRHSNSERARINLERLSELRPDWLKPAATLGAIAMDEGRYEEAEGWLERTVKEPSATAVTHHRYAQLLLRPTDGDPVLRAETAAAHALRALEIVPDDARFRLTRAQALMVAGRWDESVRGLRPLLARPNWTERAEREYAEVLRRKQQAMWSVPTPKLTPRDPEPLMAGLLAPSLSEIPPPAPVSAWPPPGTTVIHGRIDYVDCSGPDKIIVMRNPLFPMRFREPKDRPAQVFFPPDKSWKTIPCGARGWTVSLAHRPYRKTGPVRGDVAAILF